MPSPFPGMDPYLEGYLWPDVHQSLATEIRDQLAPRLKPRYVARLSISIIRDENPEPEIGIIYPDVEIVTARRKSWPISTSTTQEGILTGEATLTITKPLTVPILEVKVVTVEIRDVAHNQLVTSIEILSPVNKREPGLTQYRKKQQRLRRDGVHLLEIDLLRRGKRRFTSPGIPKTHYLVSLTRAHARSMQVWPIKLQDTLPIVAIPLRQPDPDVPLDLSAALTHIYDKAAYDYSIDYTMPAPAPSLSAEEEVWLQKILGPAGIDAAK